MVQLQSSRLEEGQSSGVNKLQGQCPGAGDITGFCQTIIRVNKVGAAVHDTGLGLRSWRKFDSVLSRPWTGWTLDF